MLDLSKLVIETPSWGYGDSGTRFGVFPQPGRPRDVFEKLDDAAEVHRLTGTAGRGRVPLPVGCRRRLRRAARADRVARAARRRGQPEPVPGPGLQARRADASRRRGAREGRRAHARVPGDRDRARLHRRSRCGWPTAPTTRARTTCASAAAGCSTASQRVYAQMPAEQELLVEYKLFEPAFYATDLADWGSALLTCLKLGDRARVLVDLGHHAQGVNIEQIVAFLADEGRLGGFHFNNRKYADDDLIVGSVNPFELFLIFVELTASDELPRLTIDQSHNIEAKVEAMVLSILNLQEAYAKALLVDRDALRAAQTGRRRARRSRGAARRLQDRRPSRVCRGARRARRGRGPDPRPSRIGLRRPDGADAMSTVTPIIDHVEDLWPDDVPGRRARSARARVAPARRQPRGLELRRRQHVGEGHDDRSRRARGAHDVGQGLRLAISRRWARSTSPRCGSTRCCR